MAKKDKKADWDDGLFDDDDSFVQGSKILSQTHTWDFGLVNEESVYQKLSKPGKHPVRRFTLNGKLGEGSMGHVFSLKDVNCGREVALKILKADDDAAVARFVKQARTVAGLEHPGIVPIYEVKVDEDRKPYMVMRQLKGTTLKDKIEAAAKRRFSGGSLPVDEIVLTFLKICDALSYAHSKGCVHQDVKPENIMLGEFGEVFLIDWGAVGLGEDVIGTPAYMSPQQASGSKVAAVDDIYCLGATLFHCLALRFPIYGKSYEELIEKKKTQIIDPLRPREKRTIPPELLSIAMKAMDPDPSKRYQSATLFADDLKNYQSGSSVKAHTESVWQFLKRWVRHHRYRVNAFLGIAAVLAVSSLLFYKQHLKEMSYWGEPLYIESFQAEDWAKHWIACKGSFRIEGQQLITNAGADPEFMMIYRDRLTGSHAIEADLEIGDEAPPGKIGVAWFRESDRDTRKPAKTLPIIVSITNGQGDAVIRQGKRDLARKSLRVVPGKKYRVRLEAESDQLRLYVNDRLTCTHTEPFPIVSGYVALCSSFSGKRFSNVHVYTKSKAEKIPVTAIGDALLAEGLYDDALVLYERVVRSHEHKPIGDRAAYQMGVCFYLTGRKLKAYKVWNSLVGTTMDMQVRRHLLAKEFAADQHKVVFKRMREMVASGNQQLVRAATSAWAEFAENLHQRNQGEVLNEYINFRNQTFPDEKTHEYVLGHIWLDGGHYSRILKNIPDERWACGEAMFRLGRHSEVVEHYGDVPQAVVKSMTVLGKMDDALKAFPEHANEIAETAFNWGRLEELVHSFPPTNQYVQRAFRELGRLDELTRLLPTNSRFRGLALLDQGNFERVQEQFINNSEVMSELRLRTGQYADLLNSQSGREYQIKAILGLNRLDEMALDSGGPLMIEAMLRSRKYLDVINEAHTTPEPWVRAGYLAGRAQSLEPRVEFNIVLRRMLYLYQGNLDRLLSLPGASPLETATFLYHRGEHDKIKSGFAQFSHLCAAVANREARYDDVLKDYPQQRSECAYATSMLGRQSLLFKNYPDQRQQIAQHLLRQGDYTRVITEYPDMRRECALAKLYLNPPWYVVREYPEQLEAHALAFSSIALNLAIKDKRGHALRSWTSLTPNRIPMKGDILVFPCFLIPQFYKALKKPESFIEYCHNTANAHRYAFAQQLWYAASYLSGGVTEAEFLAQPVRRFAPARLLLCKAMLAELNERPGKAASYYTRYRSMSYNEKPVNPVTDRFVAWRLRLTIIAKADGQRIDK